MTSIADEADVTLQHVSQVVRGFRRSPRIEQAVAKRLQMPVSKLFPPDNGPKAA